MAPTKLLEHQSIDAMRAVLEPYDQFEPLTLHHSAKPQFRDIGGILNLVVGQGTGDERRYRVTESMWDNIVSDLGAGKRYFAATPVELLYPQLNWWYGSEEADKPQVVVLTNEEDGVHYAHEIMASARYPVASVPALDVIDSYMGRDAQYLAWVNGLHSVSVAALTDDRSEEVRASRRVGDVIRGGVAVSWSPTGKVPCVVRTYVEALVCTNGMVMTQHTNTWTQPGGEGAESPYEWMGEVIPQALGAVGTQFGAIQEMAELELDEETVPTLVQDLFDTYNLPGRLREAVARQLAEVNIHNMWDVMNAFTAAATHDPQISDPMQRFRLMAAAGDSAQHTRTCPTCSHLISE